MSAPSKSSAPSRRGLLGPRGVRAAAFVFAIAIIAIASTVALHQPPRESVFDAPKPWVSAGWWLHPIERNAFLRMARTNVHFKRVAVAPGTQSVWVVGDTLQVLHSSDGGGTWSSQELPPVPGGTEDSFETDIAVTDTVATDTVPTDTMATDTSMTGITSFDTAATGTTSTASELTFDTAATGTTSTDPFATSDTVAVATSGTALTSSPDTAAPNVESPASRKEGTHYTWCIAFTDATHGWIAGGGQHGAIYETTNGGATWTHRKDLADSVTPFTDLRFRGKLGVAVGTSGAYTTSDGGAKWQWQPHTGDVTADFRPSTRELVWGQSLRLAADQRPLRLRFIDDEHLLVALSTGGILRSIDGGTSWQQVLARGSFGDDGSIALGFAENDGILRVWKGGPVVASSTRGGSALNDVVMLNRDTGIAVGELGRILRTTDGGRSWTDTVLPDYNTLAIYADRDGKHVWAAGHGGVVHTSTDGGATWTSYRTNTALFISMAFASDHRTGWATGYHAPLLKTIDGGRTWRGVPLAGIDSDDPDSIVVSADGRRAVFVSGEDRPRIFGTTDGGVTWTERRQSKGAYFTDPDNGYVLEPTSGTRTVLLHATNAGATLTPVTTFPSDVSTVRFTPDGKFGWAAQWFLSLPEYRTADGGATWTRLRPQLTDWVSDFHFASDGLHGWATARSSIPITTTDGGNTWSFLPDPKFRARVIAFGPGNVMWSTRPNGTPIHSSDFGKTWTGPATYRRIPAPWLWPALLLSFPFLYVAFRKPAPVVLPASIEIAAASDNPVTDTAHDRLGFRELANGIARFLGNENTEPPLTLAITGRWGTGKSSLMNLADAAVQRFGYCTAWFNAWHYQSEEHLLPAIIESLEREALPRWWTFAGIMFRARLLFMRLSEWLRRGTWIGLILGGAYVAATKLDLLPKLEKSEVAGWSAAAAALLSLLRTVDAFGLTPGKVSETFKTGRKSGDPGFRHEFATRLREVERALGEEHRIVLFIDDLDRCRPDHVMAILETVNFLVSSAKCFIVIGIDLQRVEGCVAMRFEEEAKKLGEAVDAESTRKYARNYLEKLINVEVPVPVATESASRDLFTDRVRADEDLAASRRTASLAKLLGRLESGVAYAAVVALLAWLVVRFDFIHAPVTTGTATEAAAVSVARTKPQPPQIATAKTSPPSAAPARQIPEPRNTEAREEPRFFETGAQAPAGGWLVPLLSAGVLIVLFAIRATLDAPMQESDSESFRTTLEEWHPLIFAADATPRSMKRCVNRVRYYAMRLRNHALPAYLNERIVQRLTRVAENDAPPAIPDVVLVPLGVIQHVCPQWLDENAFWEDTESFFTRKPLPFVLRHPARELARRSIAAHRAKFLEISRGIAIAGTDEQHVEAKLRSHFGGATA